MLGVTWSFALARFTSDGNLDPTFGDGGVLTTVITYYAVADAVAVAEGGTILAAGHSSGVFTVVRYQPDGSLDPSFGSDGVTRYSRVEVCRVTEWFASEEVIRTAMRRLDEPGWRAAREDNSPRHRQRPAAATPHPHSRQRNSGALATFRRLPLSRGAKPPAALISNKGPTW